MVAVIGVKSGSGRGSGWVRESPNRRLYFSGRQSHNTSFFNYDFYKKMLVSSPCFKSSDLSGIGGVIIRKTLEENTHSSPDDRDMWECRNAFEWSHIAHSLAKAFGSSSTDQFWNDSKLKLDSHTTHVHQLALHRTDRLTALHYLSCSGILFRSAQCANCIRVVHELSIA